MSSIGASEQDLHGYAVYDSVRLTLSSLSGAEQISVKRVSPNIFNLLGIQPSHGPCVFDREAEGAPETGCHQS